MKIKELIFILSKYDGEKNVFFEDPEIGSINPITNVDTVENMIEEEMKFTNIESKTKEDLEYVVQEIKQNYSVFDNKDLIIRFKENE